RRVSQSQALVSRGPCASWSPARACRHAGEGRQDPGQAHTRGLGRAVRQAAIREAIAAVASLPMLTGYRVLDFTQFVAGPTCPRLLAEAGAEVIKVELAPHGDRSRFQGLKPREHKQSSQSTYNFQHNHSKKSLALDLKHPRGRELLRAMVPKVDVVVENFAPGV